MSLITEKILEILQAGAENAVDLIDIATSDRSTSYRKARRSMLQGPPQFKNDWADLYRKRHAFHAMLNKLKQEGFIAKKETKRNSPWTITKLGIKKLILLKQDSSQDKTIHKVGYKTRPGAELIIISFDVPEKYRQKRNWLRSEILSLGFKKLQQSVWIGKVRIPTEFLNDLRKYDVLKYVHIFSVGPRGTLAEKN